MKSKLVQTVCEQCSACCLRGFSLSFTNYCCCQEHVMLIIIHLSLTVINRWIKWVVVTRAIHPQHCWSFWILNRTPTSLTTTWMFLSTCQRWEYVLFIYSSTVLCENAIFVNHFLFCLLLSRCCLSARPMWLTLSQSRSETGWRWLMCLDTWPRRSWLSLRWH